MRQEMSRLKDENTRLKSENAALLAENERLKKEDGVYWKKMYEAAMDELAQAKADLEVKVAAIEWAMGRSSDGFADREDGEGTYWWRKELRARAFPAPEMEKVDVKRWLHIHKINLISHIEPTHNLSDWIELTGTCLIPKPQKVKRREEIVIEGTDAGVRYLHTTKTARGTARKFFAEWEEK